MKRLRIPALLALLLFGGIPAQGTLPKSIESKVALAAGAGFLFYCAYRTFWLSGTPAAESAVHKITHTPPIDHEDPAIEIGDLAAAQDAEVPEKSDYEIQYELEQGKKDKALIRAIVNKTPNIDFITQLFARGAHPNATDEEGNSALFLALNNHPSNDLLIETLIKHGANALVQDLPSHYEKMTELFKEHFPQQKSQAPTRTELEKFQSACSEELSSMPGLETFTFKLAKHATQSLPQFIKDIENKELVFNPAHYVNLEFLNWCMPDEDDAKLEETALMYAIRQNAPTSFIAGMLEYRAPQLLPHDKNIILTAVMYGRCDIAVLLLEKGARLSSQDLHYIIPALFLIEPSSEKNSLVEKIKTDIAAKKVVINKHCHAILAGIDFAQLDAHPQNDIMNVALVTNDYASICRLAPLCKDINALDVEEDESMPRSLMEYAAAACSREIVAALRAAGALVTSDAIEFARVNKNKDALAVFDDVIAASADRLIEEEKAKKLKMQAKQMTSLRQHPSPVTAHPSAHTTETEDEPFDFQDPDGNYVLQQMTVAHQQRKPKHAITTAAHGALTHLQSPAVESLRLYRCAERVSRWFTSPDKVFVDDPQYRSCTKQEHNQVIMRHAACTIIDHHHLACTPLVRTEKPNILQCLIPCLIVDHTGKQERRIFEACVNRETREIFHRFFNRLKSEDQHHHFHTLPQEISRAAGGGQALASSAKDGSMMLEETETYLHCFDPRYGHFYFAKQRKQ